MIVKRLLLCFILLSLLETCRTKKDYVTVSAFAGNGIMGLANGNSETASFANLMGLAVDANGNVYVADSHNNLIRKITPKGTVTTFAGSGAVGSENGENLNTTFFYPEGIAVDQLGNVFVSDTHNNLIRKITHEGMVITIAGMPSGNLEKNSESLLKFDNPVGIAVDLVGNIYIADRANNVIRKITPNGKATILAGTIGSPGFRDGAGPSAAFYLPSGIATDSLGNVYISDTYNNSIRKINHEGVVSTIAGNKTKGSHNGKGTLASFFRPWGIALDKQGVIYVADMGNNKIRKITPDGTVSTFAGSGERGAKNGRDTIATFNKPYGVAVDCYGTVYVADYQNNLVRKISYNN